MKTFWKIVAGSVVVLSLSARAEAREKIGVLTCEIAGGFGFVVGSSHDASCVFEGNGRRERYNGRMKRYGLDVGYTGRSTVVWAVLQETGRYRERALEGKYVGGSADVAIGVGGGGNILVGGNDRSISLQPLSIKGETGVALGLGVGDLVLR